jgi:hypothetical protein
MSTIRSGAPGATRVCPHCKATVLESAAICPGCRHHLRFGPGAALTAAEGKYVAFSVDGTMSHKVTGEPCEYCVVLDIRNEAGEQIARQVMNVGILQPGEVRRMNVAVEMMPVRAAEPVKAAAPPPQPAQSKPAMGSSGIRSPLPPLPPPPPPTAVPPPMPPQQRIKPLVGSPRYKVIRKP